MDVKRREPHVQPAPKANIHVASTGSLPIVSTPEIFALSVTPDPPRSKGGDGIGKNDPGGSGRSVHFVHEYYRIYPLEPRFGMVSELF